jgi:transposase
MWLTQRDVLTNGNRQRIVERVRARPGIGVRALASEMGVNYKTVLYHVRVLQRSGALVLARVGMRLSCHPACARADAPAEPLSLPPPRPDPSLVRSTADVGRALVVHRSTAYVWLRRWEEAGLVARTARGWAPRGDEAFSREPRLAQAWRR